MFKKLTFLLLFLLSFSAQANEIIKIFVAVSPGGGYDKVSRVISDHLNKEGQKNIVEYVLGAGGLVAYERMATQKMKVLIVAGDSFFVNIANKKINLENYFPISFIGGQTQFLYVNKTKGINCNNFKNQRIVLGTSGKGSTSDIITKSIKQNGNLKNIEVIYYKGQPEAYRDVLSSVIDGSIRSYTTYDNTKLDILFNTGITSLNGIPSLYECLGIKESFRAEFILIANKSWKTEETKNLNSIINNLLISTHFQETIKNFDYFRLDTPKSLEETLTDTNKNVSKYKKIIQEIDLN